MCCPMYSGRAIPFCSLMRCMPSLVRGAAEGGIDASSILKPVLARGEIQIIGATTSSEYRKIEKDAALARRFGTIDVAEPTPETALKILQGVAPVTKATTM